VLRRRAGAGGRCSLERIETWLLPVAERTALAQAGAPSSLWSASSVTYALGPVALVVMLEAGDRPHGSAVYAADEVVLRTPFPDEVVAALTARADPLPIHGFVRMPEGCLPLGELRVISHRFSRAPGAPQPRFEECQLLIADRLPYAVLDRVHAVAAVDLPDPDWLDLLPGDPIGALGVFVTDWFADVRPATSAEPAVAVPAALAALYAAAAGRQEPLGGFNRLRR
jgi:hypothetical protein